MGHEPPLIQPLHVRDFLTRDSLRVAASVATWFLTALLVPFIPIKWMQNSQASPVSGGESNQLSGLSETDTRVMTVFIVLTLGLILVSRWSIAGDAFGGRWTQDAHPVARFVRATVWVVAISWVAGLLRILVESAVGSSTGNSSSVWRAYSVADRTLYSLFAGASEETLDIAIPAGLTFAIATAVSRWRTGRGRPALSTQTLWTVAIAAAVIGLITRYTDHLYQGGLSSAFAVLWGAGFLAVYAIYRSVLPLILGHFSFDAFVAGNSLIPNDWLPHLAVMVACLGGILATSYVRFYRRR
jgi:hypothetical protein